MADPPDPGGAATLPPPSTAAGGVPGVLPAQGGPTGRDEADGGGSCAGSRPGTAAVSLTDLPAGTRVTYRVVQRFRYTYDGDATDLVHRLVVVPPGRHGDQTVRDARLAVSSDAARTTWQRGADGTRIAAVRLDRVPARLDFDVSVTIDRVAGGARPWLRATALAGRRLLDATPLTAPDPALTAAARALATDDPVATARRFCGWVHSRIRYVPGSTDVATTAAQALAGGSGVCQDQAHVMLALCRAVGLPARYVSGHLVGDGPSHAWVEVVMNSGAAGRVPRTGTGGGAAAGADSWEPGAVAVAYDPCHDRLADLRYVTVAVGRDYSDVAPTSGWYTGEGRGTLTASQQVTVVEVQPVQ
ncbi:transglutaminase family protein [Frankia sp. QA3]|uniref:transglutaminase family protein n=1 Tax=Frankia sp. QA3 TaxID=710111 RepID=UPI000269CF9E|nr:transglutaminase family protein [Frankia sp. QA3]EIV95911.1 transglutaminase-like enzyme, predicted cysteine protease [Frankia sp. QA3]